MIDTSNDSSKPKKDPISTAKSLFRGRLMGAKSTETSTVVAETPTTTTTPKKTASKKPTKAVIITPDQPPTLPLVPIREGVLFPSTESVLTFGRKSSMEAIKAAKYHKDLVVLVTQKDASTEEPTLNQLYQTGTIAIVERTLKTDGQLNALVRGIGRAKILTITQTAPYMAVQVERLHDIIDDTEESTALAKHLQKQFREAVQLGKPVEFLNFMKLMSGVNDGELVDQIASTLTLETPDKQLILDELRVTQRIRQVIDHLTKELKVLEIEKDVAHKTQAKFDKHMRENVLRERLRTIQKELGEIDDEEETIGEYEQQLKKLKLEPELREKIEKEVKRLKQLSVNNPEAGYLRTWLDTIFELPWNKRSKGNADLKKAEAILDKNHFGLEKVKDRILEYIAVLQLKQEQKNLKATERKHPTILCFVGPPGVGKTSIGKSIAESLGRKFIKVSLGGIRDEAEIRGHRRTYVGAMPGRIINGIKQSGSMNPVFMLDEVDKIGADFRGDPSAALLEALDPEQNGKFEDHYLDVPFDLSEVIFITTANTLDTIPAALRDRLEIIRYAGYTEAEKFHIAKDHLLKKLYQVNGLKIAQLKLPDTHLKTVIERYTQEAGVRELERALGTIMRKVAREILEKRQQKNPSKLKLSLTQQRLREYLGPEKFDPTMSEDTDQVGLATGLAWTSVGGDMLFIEVALTPGKGQVKLTGKLGEVMQESAQAALTYVKAHATELGIDDKKLATTDVHIHVPEGAVPKDGPSAGITITTAIVSAFTNKPVRREVAMTGEVTLRGRVLRIGGLKEKSLAAHRAGCKVIIIPHGNERDLVELPESVKADIVFKPVKTVPEVLKIALKR